MMTNISNNDITANFDYNKIYYQKNKARITEIRKAYYQQHQDRIKSNSKLYYQTNKCYILEKRKHITTTEMMNNTLV